MLIDLNLIVGFKEENMILGILGVYFYTEKGFLYLEDVYVEARSMKSSCIGCDKAWFFRNSYLEGTKVTKIY